jgi:CD2-associated protein
MEVLVEHDYSAMNSDELTIKKGDRIRNVVRKEDGWYEGELLGNGRRGVFPDNFVKPIKSSSKPLVFNGLGSLNGTLKSPEDKKRNFVNGNAAVTANGGKYVQSIPTMSPPPPPPPSSSQQQLQPVKAPNLIVPPKNNATASNDNGAFLAKVLYTYTPVNEDELPIQENDTVQVLRLVSATLKVADCSRDYFYYLAKNNKSPRILNS